MVTTEQHKPKKREGAIRVRSAEGQIAPAEARDAFTAACMTGLKLALADPDLAAAALFPRRRGSRVGAHDFACSSQVNDIA